MSTDELLLVTYKATPSLEGEPVPNGQMRVCRDIPSFPESGTDSPLTGFIEARQAFYDEAERVVDFMTSCMPQGLVDAIFAVLARRQASVFHVRGEDIPGREEDEG